MYRVAFALRLSEQETEDFFRRVYLDKAFNPRNPKEFVYFYCLKMGKSYLEAQDLAAKAETALHPDEDSAAFSATVLLNAAAQDARDDEELLSYIAEHSFNFTRRNESALSTQKRLLEDLKGGDGRPGLAEQEYLRFRAAEIQGLEGRNPHSADFMLDMAIRGPRMMERDSQRASISSVRAMLPRRELSNQFPNANTLSHPDSSYILRKNIIFLYFYWYWVQDTLNENRNGDFESFRSELDMILYQCGFGPLYYGNPYDWLFLYCSACGDSGSPPLDVFRGILESDPDDGDFC